MKILYRKFFCWFIVLQLFQIYSLNAQNVKPLNRGGLEFNLSYFEDVNGEFNSQNIIQKSFKAIPGHTPNHGLTKSVYWYKINMLNKTNTDKLLFKIHNGTLTNAAFYSLEGKRLSQQYFSDSTPFSIRKYNSQYPLFNINLPPDSSAAFLLRASSNNVLDLPISIENETDILEAVSLDQWYFGIYFGIILIMFLYNSFIFVTVRDINYLYYVFYILIVGLTQACLKGYAAKFLWPNNEWLIQQAPNIIVALSGIFAIPFTISFLHVKRYSKVLFYSLIGIAIVYFIVIAIHLSGYTILAHQLLQVNASIVAIIIMVCGFYAYNKGYKPAMFFIVSWSFFLSGVIIYILKDAGVLPFNNFTGNAILLGSGIEVALLSFALADKINIYKKEKEASNEETLRVLQENARIIREQNVILETKVAERTTELNITNLELNKTLVDLKEAEAQLVESEKMASLGQLTAGIAHEINNPINFVTSNVTPLKRDVNMLLDVITTLEQIGLSESSKEEKEIEIDNYLEEIDFEYLKEEIDHLIKGINDGANRTAEIVKGLRIFSRLDEDDLKLADMNEGLDSTLILVNNLLNNKIKVEKNYTTLPLIECYPGKLNQVFLNIISNAIYAINKQHKDNPNGILRISTSSTDQIVKIKIEDNGTGMDENTRKKIFEPFFTTKDVGEGTGLGMSITYNTIKKHNGHIETNTTLGVGTEFIIELAIKHKEK